MLRLHRYAVFEPAPITEASKIGPASPDLAFGGLPQQAIGDPLSALEGIGDLSTPAEPSQVSFVRGAEPPEPVEGGFAVRAPLMPVRLISHMATAAEKGPGEPWGLEAVGATESEFTGAGVCVAVLDTGIDGGHPAFAGLIRKDNYEDFTNTGLIDKSGHGTHCAGIIFGRDMSGQRIGVARGVDKVLIGKIADNDTLTSTEQIEKALIWALGKGADIISMSVGLDFLAHTRELRAMNVPEEAAIALALTDYRDYAQYFDLLMARIVSPGRIGRSALVVAAAGNESHADGNPSYRIAATLPATASDVVSVGALGRDGGMLHVAPFSNERVNICAPGVGILSAAAGGGLGTMTGTSQAAPHVAGVAALWHQKLRRDFFRAPSPSMVRESLLGRAEFAAISPRANFIEIGRGLARAP